MSKRERSLMQTNLDPAICTEIAKRGHDISNPVRLEGGRSNLVYRIGDRVLKLYDCKRPNPLFANDPHCEAKVLRALAGTGLAPALCDQGQWGDMPWIVYAHIDGGHWQDAPARVAGLLAQVHSRPVPDDLPKGANGSADLRRQTEAMLREADAGDLAMLCPPHEVAATQDTVLVHGDPVPGNILVAADGLRLIDWQCPAHGDAAEDLAIFLSPAMQFLYRGAPLAPHQETEFLDSYPNQNVVLRYRRLSGWYHWRMAAYCAWRAQRDGARDRHALALEVAKLKSLAP